MPVLNWHWPDIKIRAQDTPVSIIERKSHMTTKTVGADRPSSRTTATVGSYASRRGRALCASALLATLTSFVAIGAGADESTGFTTSVKPYARSISPDYVLVPLLSVGDRVPHTSDSTKQFQMIGVPDGLGAYKAGGGNSVLYMNHELAGANQSEPVIGEPLHRGAFVSKITLNAAGEVLSGER